MLRSFKRHHSSSLLKIVPFWLRNAQKSLGWSWKPATSQDHPGPRSWASEVLAVMGSILDDSWPVFWRQHVSFPWIGTSYCGLGTIWLVVTVCYSYRRYSYGFIMSIASNHVFGTLGIFLMGWNHRSATRCTPNIHFWPHCCHARCDCSTQHGAPEWLPGRLQQSWCLGGSTGTLRQLGGASEKLAMVGMDQNWWLRRTTSLMSFCSSIFIMNHQIIQECGIQWRAPNYGWILEPSWSFQPDLWGWMSWYLAIYLYVFWSGELKFDTHTSHILSYFMSMIVQDQDRWTLH